MTLLLTIIHIVVCFFLVVIVLLQHGKGADMGATFGGSSQTVFGTEGPLPLLNKITTGAAIVFMLTSLGLAFLSSHPGKQSVMRAVAPPPPAPLENTLERAPTTIPLPNTTTSGQTESASKQFPGAMEPPPVNEEQAPVAAPPPPTEPEAPTAEPQQQAPAATPEAQGESKQ